MEQKKRVQECKKFKIPFVFDPGQNVTFWNQGELRQIIKSAKVFIVNDYELELAKKITGWNLENILNNVNVLIVTLGEKGSVIYDQKKGLEIPAVKAKNVDPTGAGDAYRAGILKGLANGWDWEKTGRLASFCGSCAVEHYGTQEHKFSQKFIKSIKSKVG
ncbi:MAG: PfkB family carbohydrate kinase [bacterium]